MGWLQLVTAIFSFAKEVFKYMREQEENNKTCAVKIKGVTNAIRDSRKSKDTSKLESAFNSIFSADFPNNGA